MPYSALLDKLSDSTTQSKIEHKKRIPPVNQLRENFSLFLEKIKAANEFLNKPAQLDTQFMENQKNDELRIHMEKANEELVTLLDLMNLGFNYLIDRDPLILDKLKSEAFNAHMKKSRLMVLYEHIKSHDNIEQYINGLLSEINEHKAIENELKSSEKYLQLLLESGRMHCWDWNIESSKMNEFGYITETSCPISNSPEYTFESFINNIIVEDREKVREKISQAFVQGERELEIEYRSLMINNVADWVYFRGKIFYDHDNTPRRMIGIEAIITEQKKIRQSALKQWEKLDLVTRNLSMCEIANTLAHELAAPFAGINTNINYCIEQLNSNAEVKKSIVDAMKNAIKHVETAGEIIHRMKDFYRKTELHYETIIINDLIKETESLIQYENIHDIPTTIIFDLPEDSLIIEADRIHMKQVLLNLMRNRITAMQEQTITSPTLIIRIMQKNQQTISVSIEDNGSGIDATLNEILFSSCFSKKPDITNIELAMSLTIIEAHGGQLEACNLPSGGACFQFTLPMSLNECHE